MQTFKRIIYSGAEPLPGLLLTTVIAFTGLWLSGFIGETLLGFEKSPVSGIMMAIIIGMLVGNLLPIPGFVKPGITFSMKTILRLGIILLGIRLSLGEIARFGAIALPVVVLCIAGALLVTRFIGRRLGISGNMSTLIAVGTGICGATAIVATAPGIKAREEETAYAVANITIFGIIAMFVYPYIAYFIFGGDHGSAGIFLGSSIHETAQVAGAGLIYSQVFNAPEALDAAAVTKLLRNTFIAVVVPLMTWMHYRKLHEGGKEGAGFLQLFPVFILGFLLAALIRTIGDLTLEQGSALMLFSAQEWGSITGGINLLSERLLAVAMAGIGAGTGFKQLRSLGIKPFYAGLTAALAVGLISLGVIFFLKVSGIFLV